MTDENKPITAKFLQFPKGYFRIIEQPDASYIFVWVNDPELRPFFNRSTIEMFEDEVDWINGLGKRKQQNLVLMVCLDDGTRVGTMGLHSINLKDGTATTGAMFGNKDCHGKGIGYIAKMVFLNHAFNVLNLRQIYSEVLSFNTRSIRYNERCGYRVIAKLPNHVKHGDVYHDHVIMIVTRDEWLPIWEKFCIEHQIESFSEMIARTMK